MSTINKIALNAGYAPRAAINSAPVRSLVIGATSDSYHASRKSAAIQSVVGTLVELGFTDKEAKAIALDGK